MLDIISSSLLYTQGYLTYSCNMVGKKTGRELNATLQLRNMNCFEVRRVPYNGDIGMLTYCGKVRLGITQRSTNFSPIKSSLLDLMLRLSSLQSQFSNLPLSGCKIFRLSGTIRDIGPGNERDNDAGKPFVEEQCTPRSYWSVFAYPHDEPG